MTVTRFTVIDDRSHAVDIAADLVDDARSEELSAALGTLGLSMPTIYVDGRATQAATLLSRAELTHGATVTTRPSAPAGIPPDGVHLVVVSGPDAGAWHPLAPDRPVRVGRNEGELVLGRDRVMSRVHAEFQYTGGRIIVRDLGSSNGTEVEGVAITGPTEIGLSTYVQVGASAVTVMSISHDDRAILTSPDGPTYSMPRTFRTALAELPKEVRLPRSPADHRNSGSSTWWRSLLPLATGVGFAVVTGNYIFLLLSALAPVIYTVDALRQKRRRESTHQQSTAEHEQQVAESNAAFTALWTEERRRRRAASPMGGVATLFAASRHRRLWERRPGDHDFCHVTVGLAALPSAVALVDPDGDDNRQRTPAAMWGAPVDVDLLATGAVAVLGEPDRGRAVVRGMLLGLGVTHSPGDVRVWVLADAVHAAEWAPVRWLPHAMADDESCQLATLPESRGAMLAALKGIVDQRLEARRPGQQPADLPVHVVVFDGAELARGRDFSDILSKGAAVGVIGIVVDSLVAPEGVMGILRLGAQADLAVFESHSQPRIEGLLSAEVSARWAEPAARRLAALRPAATGPATLSEVSPRLAAMVGADSTTATQLAQQWQASEPRSRVAVGASAGADISMDIVRDGPHGLVGGMTRSGKTEFLKTLITSLAWANHPDDLSIAIVDFKGGIDYTATSVLPHVLDVSSNQDLDGFERTIRLMAAELRRRQRLFEPLQVANLDAYRVARQRDRSLIPVPRLIVLVDEFGEMLNSDVGREQLRQLESMARIGGGLGVHLLLITQNFEGQLPDQIAANAGFRVCFRVQDPSHSKIVLGSGQASNISASAKGRGYARMQGGEPFEFQSARVAGRRPDLQGRSTPVSARIQTIDSLAFASRDEHSPDVPAEETDMFRMFQLIAEAARQSGWQQPAIPWPKRLPDDLPLADVMPARRPGVFPIGLVDVPEDQAQLPYSFTRADEHTALLGGPRADLDSVLVTFAMSMATTSSPSELHLYGIDYTGRGLARIARLPHCGGVAGQSETLSVRIAHFLADEAARRRAELASAGVSSMAEYRDRTGRSFPHIVLLIAGAERLSGVGNYEEASGAAPFVASLISQGSGLGIQVFGAGLPSFAQFRPGAQMERRIVFSSADNADYTNLGCPRSLTGELGGPRRAVDVGRRLVFQVASLAAGAAGEADVLDALIDRIDQQWAAADIATPPRRLMEVGWPIKLPVLLGAAGRPPARTRSAFPVGFDSNSGDAVWLIPSETGRLFFVTGGRRSGRSTAAMAIAQAARAHGWSVIATAASETSPFHDFAGVMPVVDLAAVDSALAPARSPRMVVIDDLHRLNADDPRRPTTLSNADLVVVVGPVSLFAGLQRQLTELGLDKSRNGLVLMPAGFADVDPLGVSSSAVRPEMYKGKKPGQGLIGLDGELVDVTIPLVDPAD